MCASGNFSRSRSSAGVVNTASPSQFTPRTKIRRGSRIEDRGWFAIFYLPSSILACENAILISVLPAAVNPEAVRRVAADGDFERQIHFSDDVGGWTRMLVGVRGDGFAHFHAPFCRGHAVANATVKIGVVAQGQHGGGEAGIAIVA